MVRNDGSSRWSLRYAMSELRQRHGLYLASHLILVLVGLVLVLLGGGQLTMQHLWVPVGASLVAMGIAGAVLFLRVWMDQEQVERIRDMQEFGVKRIFAVRSVKIEQEYDTRVTRASAHIDIMGFGLKALREDYGRKFSEWAERATVRILVLDPEFPSTEQTIANLRDAEEGNSKGDIARDVKQLVEHCRSLMADTTLDFEVRLYRCLPSVNLFRIDDDIFWGPYLVGDVSRNMPTFLIESHGRLGRKLVGHFESIWNDSKLSREAPRSWTSALGG